MGNESQTQLTLNEIAEAVILRFSVRIGHNIIF